MEVIHLSKCPVCGSEQIGTFIHGKDYFASQEAFDIVNCESCGFLFTQDFPDESRIDSYYQSSDYISHSDTQKGLINSLYHSVRSYILKSKAVLVEKQSGVKDRLLDVGGGTGYFAGEMRRRGWNVSVVEKNAPARQFTKATWDIDAFDADDLFTLEKGSYDVITLWHVMEHLQKLHETFDQLNTLLKDDGTLIVALPNADSYDAQKYKSYWAAYDLPRHLWHFKPYVFGKLAAQHGFKIQNMVRMPFDVFYIAMLSEKYRGKPLGLMRAFCNGMAGYFKSLADIHKTSSLIYVLKKEK